MGTLYNFINVGVWNIHRLFSKLGAIKLDKMENIEFVKRLKSSACKKRTAAQKIRSRSLLKDIEFFPNTGKLVAMESTLAEA